ncbi:MAG TPA: DUF4135 domain-containing protein [Stellaceae bacterium]|nr:DUF4135 domain-containing protein [Stellaceae bacterium]
MNAADFALSRGELTAIAERASWPEERLGELFERDTGPSAQEQIDRRFAVWRNLLAKDNDAAFRRTLAWRGIDPDSHKDGFGPVRLKAGAAMPEWAEDFDRLMREAAACDAGAPRRGSPWAPLFLPLVEAAARPIRGYCEILGVAPEACSSLERHLLAALIETCEVALNRDALAVPSLAAAIEFGKKHAEWQDLPGAAAGFFLRYPVLARLVTLKVLNWRGATTEFLDRLGADQELITATFFGGAAGPLVEVDIENADPHDGGRMVMMLTFSDGRRLAYKPRSLALDVSFESLVGWLRRHDLTAELRVPRTLDRGDYGWCEFIDHQEAAGPADMAAFYRNAGGLLALAYALDAGDLHHENLIASGRHIVPIDLETVLQPRLIGIGPEDSAGAARHRLIVILATSVVQTGLVPNWTKFAGSRFVDISAFGDPQRLDAHHLHRPSSGPIEPVLAHHAEEIAGGFRDTYCHLMALRDAITAPDGPLAAMAGKPVRFLFRDTQIYARIMRRSLAADSVSDGADYDIALERLARALCVHQAPPPYLGMIEAERTALRWQDVPRFRAVTSAVEISDRDEVVAPAFLEESALARAFQRFARLSAEDLERQLRFLRLALQGRIAASSRATEPQEKAGRMPASAGAGYLERARALAERIEANAIVEEDCLGWADLAREDAGDPLGVAIGSPSLGYGAAGIGLFYAALARLGAADAEARFASVLRLLHQASDQLASPRDFYRALRIPIGLANGFGGLTYALTAIARIGGSARAFDLARGFAEPITHAAITAETGLDVHSGLAGAVLGIAALYRLTQDSDVEERLKACGDRLATAASEDALSRLPDLGLLGGAAGVALAALRLEEIMPNREWRSLCRRALRFSAAAPGRHGWGYGATGVRLVQAAASVARLCAPPDLADAVCDALGAPDTLADGRVGEADAIAEIGRRLDRAALVDDGRTAFCDLIGRRRSEPFRLFPLQIAGAEPVGLFHGYAGIGYQCLRQLEPGVLPCLLLFE